MTRRALLRLARYAERLGFEVEPQTARLAAAARLETAQRRRASAASCGWRSPSPTRSRCSRASRASCRSTSIATLLEGALALAPPDADRAMLVLGAIARDAGLARDARADAPASATIALACAQRELPADTRRRARCGAPGGATPVEAVAVAGARGDRDAARDWIERAAPRAHSRSAATT